MTAISRPLRAVSPEHLLALQEAERSDTYAGGYVPVSSSSVFTGYPSTVTGLPVAGYRPQRPEDVALVNENKVLEEKVLRQIDRHQAKGQEFDQRFVALARTHLEIAFMLLNRSVFQPQRLSGDL